jgi:hypothetical protein
MTAVTNNLDRRIYNNDFIKNDVVVVVFVVECAYCMYSIHS